jgi:hypothetical protein
MTVYEIFGGTLFMFNPMTTLTPSSNAFIGAIYPLLYRGRISLYCYFLASGKLVDGD